MSYNNTVLKQAYERTDGNCHICREKLSFSNYAQPGRRGAWEIDHSVPLSKGGKDHHGLLAALLVPPPIRIVAAVLGVVIGTVLGHKTDPE